MPRVHEAIARVVASGQFILGPEVRAFESEAADFLGVPHAIGVANGTDALVIALRACGVEPGDEVICPAYTFYASAEAVVGVGAVPVFVDIDPVTYCVSPEAVESAITPMTRAILAVHLFGQAADLDALRSISDEHDLALIEDAAQAFGARLADGRCCGSVGDAATFSFFPTKNLSTFGDGGLVTCRDDAVAERVRMLRFHGSRDKQRFELIGYNSRLDELHAAILRVFLPELDGWNDARREAGRRYAELGLGEAVGLPPSGIHHLYVVRADERAAISDACAAAGVQARTYYGEPMHEQPVFSHLELRHSLAETDRAAASCLALPMFPTITREQQASVVEAVVTAAVRA